MHLRTTFLPLIPFVCLVAHAQEAPPIEALKYHEALLKHPNNPTIFSRFYDAWIDAQSIKSLEEFLTTRAETQGGIHYTILARYQLRRGQDPNALLSLDKAITAFPNDPALLLERANLLVRSLDFIAARKDLEAVAKLGNEAQSIEAAKLIGNSHLREGNPEAAIQAWEKILTNHPNNEDLLEDLVELSSSAEQSDQALKYSAQLIAASADPYKKALRLIRRGELLAKAGESDKAITLWSETLSQTGEGSWLEREILAHIEQSFRRLDRIDLLSAKLEELAQAHPRRLHIHRELAKLEAASGNIDSAIGRFREVLRRSPGEPELREEFIRLLIQSERFDDASAELGKMLTTTPDNPELHIRLAELAYQKAQANPDLDKKATSTEILKSLEQAREHLDPGESSGLRIANLMLRFGLGQNGETLLQELSTKPGATNAPAEALAVEYARTKRPSKALEILTKLAKSPDSETVLRSTSAMAPLAKPEVPFNILLSRLPEFSNNSHYITALIQASLAAKKPAEAIPSALTLVRGSKLTSEIQDATKLACAVITAAEKAPDIIAELTKSNERSNPETCLLAALLEIQKEHEKSDALFQNTIDPSLLRFHSSLLSVRGDFKAAIAALERLAETSADNSASYLKELSDLQLRSGDPKACLTTIEQWKIAAPTDKTPWVIAARIHQESGDIAEAIVTTRRALARFNNDEDLSASLAGLYQQTGEYAEAEQIYWKLYDQAADPGAQSRWAARLSQLANNSSRTHDLKEKLLLRARSNSQSLGPVLALVELARVTNDKQAVLDHLHQALRIKPKDFDIRLQLASAERQAGNLQQQIAILNEGLAHDSSGRIHTSLAQAYIDQGDAIKGLHMLRSLAGEGASDPRIIESSASSLANSGLVAEAIQYMQESLPPDADWRARFLLASLLENDGREAEAIPIFLSLLDASTEIPNLPARSSSSHYYNHQPQQQNPRDGFEISALIQAAYRIKERNQNPHNRGGLDSYLPSTSHEARLRSTIQLALIASSGNPELAAKIQAAQIKDLPFITDLLAVNSRNEVDFIALLKKHPDYPGLLQIVLQNGLSRQADPAYLEVMKGMLDSPAIDPQSRILITMALLRADPESDEKWNNLLALLSSASKPDSEPAPDPFAYGNRFYHLIHSLLSDRKLSIPEDKLPKLRELLLNYTHSESISEAERDQYKISTYALLQDIDSWIAAINSSVKTYRIAIKEQLDRPESRQITISHRYRSHHNLAPPQIKSLPILSIPTHYLYHILEYGNHRRSASQFTLEELLKKTDRFESPLIRAWIACMSGDAKAIETSLAVSPPEIEQQDFALLRIAMDSEAKRYPETCRALLKLSQSNAEHPWIQTWAESSFLGTVSLLTKEQQAEFREPLEKILQALTKPPLTRDWQYQHNQSQYAQIARNFNFEVLVKAFTASQNPTTTAMLPRRPPPAAAVINKGAAIMPTQQRVQTPQPVTPLDRFKIYTREGKNTAAAHELLNWIRSQKKRGNDASSIFRSLENSFTEEVRKEVLLIADPENTPGINKRLEYIDLCRAINEPEKALATLRALAAERPFDASITTDLAFSLPPEEIDAAVDLLKNAAQSTSFEHAVNAAQQRIGSNSQNPRTFALFDLYAKFLEACEPDQCNPRAIRQMVSHIVYFFSGNNLSNIPSLISRRDSEPKESPDIDKHRVLARRLSNAMLRHPSTAETGFRLIHAANWIEKPEELDELARASILLDAQSGDTQGRSNNMLNEHSSIAWLCKRVQESSTPSKIITPDFIATLGTHQPKVATLLTALIDLKSDKDITRLWESEEFAIHNSDPSLNIVRHALMSKMAGIPGAARVFINRIQYISKEDAKEADPHTGQNVHVPLFRAALETCKNQSADVVQQMCSAMSKAIYGETLNDENLSNSRNLQSIFDYIFNDYHTDPVTAVRIIRAFDFTRTPIGQYYWFQNSLQKNRIEDHDKALEFLDSIGFLEDTPSWKPLAVSSIQAVTENANLQPTFKREHAYIEESITRNFDSKLRQPEFIASLENRTPQTFGALITAANLSSGSERSRLAAKAFQHASKYLSKASPERLEDFSLLISYLPDKATPSLPKLLQTKADELKSLKIEKIHEDIEKKFTHIQLQPNQNPFSNIQNEITQLAAFDMDMAIDVFLRADELYEANAAYLTAEQSNWHEMALASIIQTLASSRNPEIKDALLFYRAIRNSPRSDRFGISDKQSGRLFLASFGYSLSNRQSTEKRPGWANAWAEVDKLPEDMQIDAMAGIVCHSLSGSLSYPRGKVSEEIDKFDLSPESRKFALACATIYNWRNEDQAARDSASETILTFIQRQDLTEDTRTQIAFSASLSPERLLSHPPTAKVISEIIATYCDTDHSVVDSAMMRILQSIASLQNIEPVLPYLQTMNAAFWKNANSPKPRGHRPIQPNDANALFATAVRLGDQEAIKHLFPHVRTPLIGNIDTMASLILAGLFDLATDLLPEQSGTFTYNRRSYLTPEFEQNLDAFCSSLNNPDQALRFRCQLLHMRNPNGNQRSTEEAESYRQQLVEIYRKDPPKSPQTKIEVLGIIATSLNPLHAVCENDITEAAATLDVKNVLRNFIKLHRQSQETGNATQYEFEIIRQAAMIQFINGDPSLFATVCNELASAIRSTSPEDIRGLLSNYSYFNNDSPFSSFLKSAAQWISLAAVDGKTGSFAKSITPLRELAIAMAESKARFGNLLGYALALHDFISHWENSPEDLTPVISEFNNTNNESELKRFTHPRSDFSLLSLLRTVQSSKEIRGLGPKPYEFLVALLSRPSLTNILVTDNPWLNQLSYESNEQRARVNNLAEFPPESISPTGRLLLRFQYAVRNYRPESTETYRALLEEAPATHHWDSFRVNCKLYLAEALLRADADLTEARTLMNSMDPEKLSTNVRNRYNSCLKRLEAAEAKRK